MNFRVQNVHKGHCEVWANMQVGQRYRRMAVVERDPSDGMWRWAAGGCSPAFEMPFLTYAFPTRSACIRDCKRRALMVVVRKAIEEQDHESVEWHSPRRDAWCTVTASHVFTEDELREIKRRLETFEDED